MPTAEPPGYGIETKLGTHQLIHPSTHMPQLLHTSLSTSFRCAGRVVHVSIVGQHSDTGRPIVTVEWSGKPDRMKAEDIAVFDAAKAAALATLRARMAQLQSPTT